MRFEVEFNDKTYFVTDKTDITVNYDEIVDGERLTFSGYLEDEDGNRYKGTWLANDGVPLAGAGNDEWDAWWEHHESDELYDVTDVYDVEEV